MTEQPPGTPPAPAGGNEPAKPEGQGSPGGQPASPPPGFMPPPPPPGATPAPRGGLQRVVKKLDPIVARTKLDLDACRDVVSRMVSDKEVKVTEELATRPTEAPKPRQPILKYRKSTPCSAKWDEMTGTERFRICSECKLHVYDFSLMDMTEVEELVLQREGKPKKSFYKRNDGKFLMSNCPVGMRRGITAALSIAAATIAGLGFLAYVFLSPRPQERVSDASSAPSSTQEAWDSVPLDGKATSEDGKGQTSSADGGAGNSAPPEMVQSNDRDDRVEEDLPSGVMAHPYKCRPVIPRGGYPDPNAPTRYRILPAESFSFDEPDGPQQ